MTPKLSRSSASKLLYKRPSLLMFWIQQQLFIGLQNKDACFLDPKNHQMKDEHTLSEELWREWTCLIVYIMCKALFVKHVLPITS